MTFHFYIGTYNSAVRQQDVDDCLPCPGGHYCPTPGMTAEGPECTEGKYPGIHYSHLNTCI